MQVDDVAPTGTVTVALSGDGIPTLHHSRERGVGSPDGDDAGARRPFARRMPSASAASPSAATYRGTPFRRWLLPLRRRRLRVLRHQSAPGLFLARCHRAVSRARQRAQAERRTSCGVLAQLFGLTGSIRHQIEDPHAGVSSATGCPDTRSGGQPAVSGGRMVRLPVGSDHRCGYRSAQVMPLRRRWSWAGFVKCRSTSSIRSPTKSRATSAPARGHAATATASVRSIWRRQWRARDRVRFDGCDPGHPT